MRHRDLFRTGLVLLAVVALTLPGVAAPAVAGPGAARAAGAAARPVASQPSAAPTARREEPRWSVQPSSRKGVTGKNHFVYDLSPGEQIIDYVGISNLGKEPITLDTYPTDAFNTEDGAFALLPTGQDPRGVGAWIRLPQRSYTIAPGKRLDVPFTLKVPANAEPGDHPGAVVAAMSVTATGQEGQQVTIERRIGARVYLRVSGPVEPSVQITGMELRYDNPLVPFPGGDLIATYRVANLGNVRVTGKARIQVKGPLGVRLGHSEMIDIPELLPDSEIRLTSTIHGVFPAGPITASLAVNPETVDKKEAVSTARRSVSTSAVPWGLLIFLGVLVAVVVLVFVLRRRRRRLLAEIAAGDGGFHDAADGDPTPAAAGGRRTTGASG
ncbi:WxL protein peptidoglycan domain-containing protein [Micromonospora sp. NPDC093277]|uniref:WxL protein peptidoglycan domain-containing protein n=1 Tax=Micromonospora sp. NPDC093277 TaxID=3364291 RepID=UPI0037FB0B74